MQFHNKTKISELQEQKTCNPSGHHDTMLKCNKELTNKQNR